ncbi:hypothetical protein DFH06DRAFT_1424695 [Mycena polygramma]|nr:hypothetical protein DFH06DRAFT_1424695 [Mycena polygramma]
MPSATTTRKTLPFNITSKYLSGVFRLNSTSQTEYEMILEAQGLADAATRHAVATGELLLGPSHDMDTGKDEIIVGQDYQINGHNIKTEEKWILDWYPREHNDPLVGPVTSQMRRYPVSSPPPPLHAYSMLRDRSGIQTGTLEHPILQTAWTSQTRKLGVMYYYAKARGGHSWDIEETWGIEELGGERHFARHVRLRVPGEEVIESKLIYDYREFFSPFACVWRGADETAVGPGN